MRCLDMRRRHSHIWRQAYENHATTMKRPKTRLASPPRRSENAKRKLFINITAVEVRARYRSVSYNGSSKHKQNPHLFGLEPFRGHRGDRTLCDKHASFSPQDIERIPALLQRALRARLVGSHVWTVDDNGWIYELVVTNQQATNVTATPCGHPRRSPKLSIATSRVGPLRTAPRPIKLRPWRAGNDTASAHERVSDRNRKRGFGRPTRPRGCAARNLNSCQQHCAHQAAARGLKPRRRLCRSATDQPGVLAPRPLVAPTVREHTSRRRHARMARGP